MNDSIIKLNSVQKAKIKSVLENARIMNKEDLETLRCNVSSSDGNMEVKADGYVFDSMKEWKRYMQLKILLKAKKISDLTLQPEYVLQESFKHDSKTHRMIKYVADFRYIQNGNIIVEDVKGFLTDIYKLKKKAIFI